MSLKGRVIPHIQNMAEDAIRRPVSIGLPEDPSQEQLAQYWTLSARDKEEVLRSRGDVWREGSRIIYP